MGYAGLPGQGDRTGCKLDANDISEVSEWLDISDAKEVCFHLKQNTGLAATYEMELQETHDRNADPADMVSLSTPIKVTGADVSGKLGGWARSSIGTSLQRFVRVKVTKVAGAASEVYFQIHAK